MLEKSDPEQAIKIHPNNRRRVIRSLTIQKNTGKTQSEIEKEQKHELLFDPFIIGCTMDRKLLYQRINQRVDKMFEDGLEDEIKTLLNQGVLFTDTCMEGIGYKEWKEYFRGNMTIEEVKQLIQKNSRNFAKRQYTWFKHQMPVRWYDVTNPEEDIWKEIDTFLEGSL